MGIWKCTICCCWMLSNAVILLWDTIQVWRKQTQESLSQSLHAHQFQVRPILGCIMLHCHSGDILLAKTSKHSPTTKCTKLACTLTTDRMRWAGWHNAFQWTCIMAKWQKWHPIDGSRSLLIQQLNIGNDCSAIIHLFACQVGGAFVVLRLLVLSDLRSSSNDLFNGLCW